MRTLFGYVLRPSRVTLVAAGAVVGLFLIWMALLTPERLHALLSAYPGFDRLDERYFLFDRLTKLRHSKDTAEIRITIIGGSTTRESFWSENELADEIGQRIGRFVSVVDLTSSDQSLHLSWSLMEEFICGHRGQIAVLGANLARFKATNRLDPALSIGYRTEGASADRGTHGWGFGRDLYLFENRGFVAQSLQLLPRAFVADLFERNEFRKVPNDGYGRHRYLRKVKVKNKPHDLNKITKRALRAHLKYASRTPESYNEAVKTLTKMVQTVQACGGQLILLDTPVNPWLMQTDLYRTAYENHQRALSALAEKWALIMINPNRVVPYQISDFYDQGHLMEEGAIRATSKSIADGITMHIQGGNFSP